MELDVHLTREGEEPWGFEFIGGADYGMPLTISKVFPSSPADASGLQPGDLVARLGDRLATELSQEAARGIVAEAVGSLSFGICRGLYDPVLDEYEPIYDPIERADSDLRSEPTEVPFSIQQFGDPNDLSLDDPRILDPSLTDPSLFDSGYATRPLTETRSLTASPFVPNTKPYRPFSTEPLEVPPLDDPIVLNPNFKDTFAFKDDFGNVKALDPDEENLLRLIPLDKNVKAKFKLPISEKYDPEWDKKVKSMLEKCVEGGKRETENVEHELVCYAADAALTDVIVSNKVADKTSRHVKVQDSVQQVTKEEVSFNKVLKYENDIKNIEQTALEVVEESIERAVSVTEEIQKEVEEELRASMIRELHVEETQTTSETTVQMQEVESRAEKKESIIKSEVKESVQLETNEVKEMKQEKQTEIKFKDDKNNEYEDLNLKGGVSLAKTDNERKAVEEQKLSIQQELVESISVGTVKRKSIGYEAEIQTETTLSPTMKVSYSNEKKSEQVKDCKSSGGITTESLQSESKQKAFMIGLETIPHIKGFVQSSYHFDLLLRTFFVHLTDVMVALSRFILTQPTTELESKAERIIKEKHTKEFATQDSERYEKKNKTEHTEEEITLKEKGTGQGKHQQQSGKEMRQEQKFVQAEQEVKVKSKVSKDSTQQEQKEYKKSIQIDQNICNDCAVTSFEETDVKKKSGAEMAQMTLRKTKDLTKKMNAVISEFETKSGIEDRLEVTEQVRRRSRSRSQIEEEVMKESDPLEWLDKVDSRRTSQERSDIITTKNEFTAYTESKENRKMQTNRESRSTKVKPGKQMYVAVVESHVYTNKDTILEDQVAEISETASVQSSEEINAALELSEAFSTENVAISSLNMTDEKQQAVEVITNALEEVVQEKQEILEEVTDCKSQTNNEYSKSVMQEMHTLVAAESTELMSESKVEMFETKKSKGSKATTIQEETYKSAAVEFVEVPLEATTKISIESKASNHGVFAKQELLATVAAESTDIIIDESKLESFKSQTTFAKTAAISAEENYKATAINTTETILEASKEDTIQFKMNEQHAVAQVESLAIAVAESTDVVADDSKVETFQTKETVSKKATVATEETFKMAAIESTEVTLEMAEEEHSERSLTGHVTIREEIQAFPVAGIIETKTEVCNEPKKPAEDEYASLKIIKEEVIDGSECIEMLSESELNIKKSLEVEMSSSQHIQSSISQSHQSYQSISKEISTSVQENSLSTQSSKLHLRTDLALQNLEVLGESDENNNTPSPSTVPPTPLTDEYVFKLQIPLPKNQGTVVIEESPDREDPHIVKKGLVPYIDTTIEDQIIYDPPLPTPPEDRVQSPVYTKPGLRGGGEPLLRKEYIREIERKSSLLASAIDETIKSIEEYKEEVGIDKKSVKFETKTEKYTKSEKQEDTKITNGFNHTNGFSNGYSTDSDKDNEEWVKVEKQMTDNDENVQELSKETAIKASSDINGDVETDKQKEQDDALPGFKPVVFNPEAYQAKLYEEVIRDPPCAETPKEVRPYVNEAGEPLGTVQGIVDGLEEAVVDEEVAKELGKPGLTEDKIAVLISGESEMLREAHVMGLTRVLTSHMTRPDDSSVDFHKIKPLVDSLKDSEVLKALNDELLREMSEKKKKEEEKNWTTFLQKPKRPVPKAKFGYYGYVEPGTVEEEEPYKVKIVKQPKPKVAPDYKPEDFETGPLPWEQRALTEPVPSPVPPEDPILIPEETPEFLEAIDPLPESEVPDLEDTGIPLPASPPTPPPEEPLPPTELQPETLPEQPPEPKVEEPPKVQEDMDQNKMAEQLVNTVRRMVDPQASLEQQLTQMRAQLDALAQLPCVIQQSLEVLTRQLSAMSHQETQQMESHQEVQVRESTMASIQEYNEQETIQNNQEVVHNGQEECQNGQEEHHTVTIEEIQPEQPTLTVDEHAALKKEEAMVEEQRRSEKEKKEQQEKVRLDQESRQIKQRPTPRVGKPRPVFGPLTPEERPLVLPGGRRWRGPKDAYNEQMIAETLQSQSEIIQGKVMGYESDLLPYDERINFMKYEKPPVSLDHLQNSATYKMIHNMEQEPLRRVDLLTPVVAEADYKERCRSVTPCVQNGRM